MESLIIISSFVMLYLGMVYFRTLYINQIQSSRLARGSTLMYSMAGCDQVNVSTWLDKDKRNYSVNFPGKSSDTVPGGTSSGSTESQSVQSDIGAGNGSFANPIMAGQIGATPWAGTKSTLTGQKKVYKQDLKSTSYVTCGDVPRDGDFEEVLGYVKKAFSGKM